MEYNQAASGWQWEFLVVLSCVVFHDRYWLKQNEKKKKNDKQNKKSENDDHEIRWGERAILR